MKRVYDPKHSLPEGNGEERPPKRRRAQWVYLSLTVLYLAAVAGVTVYGQAMAPQRLPRVVIVAIDNGKVPESALVGNEDTGYLLNTVEQTDGP